MHSCHNIEADKKWFEYLLKNDYIISSRHEKKKLFPNSRNRGAHKEQKITFVNWDQNNKQRQYKQIGRTLAIISLNMHNIRE